MGEPVLRPLSMRFLIDGQPSDSAAIRYGIREVTSAGMITTFAGNGQVKCNLFIWLERQVRQVERVAIDEIPVLLVTGQPPRTYGDALVAQEPLVPLESLAPGAVSGRIPGHPVGDLPQAERARRVEQDQKEVGDPFKPVEACHQGQSRGRSKRGRP